MKIDSEYRSSMKANPLYVVAVTTEEPIDISWLSSKIQELVREESGESAVTVLKVGNAYPDRHLQAKGEEAEPKGAYYRRGPNGFTEVKRPKRKFEP